MMLEKDKRIDEIYWLAKEGRTPNSADFKLGSKAKDIREQWGEENIYPTRDNRLIFPIKDTTFGLDCNMDSVTAITDISGLLYQVTPEDVIVTLGKPDIEVKYNKYYEFALEHAGDIKLEYVIDADPNHVDSARRVLSFYFPVDGYFKAFTVRDFKIER